MTEYQALTQKIELTMTCHNCHTKHIFNPEVKEEVMQTAGWIKVQRASGEAFAYCGVDCLHKGAHNLKPKSSIELVEG